MIAPPVPSSSSCRTPQELVTHLANLVRNGDIHQFGTFSVAIYDTAWVSMVHKVVDGRVVWLFDQCFDFLLEQQREDGLWVNTTTAIDGVINTAAGLLSLLTHSKIMREAGIDVGHLQIRIAKAERGFRNLLEEWSVETTDAVGFEILVPSLLRQISELGLDFDFPGSERLENLYQKKITKFKPEFVYSDRQLTLIHSLEGLVGLIDFDKVRHHCSPSTGMLASPASTAAYLMHCSVWDEAAESYLKQTLKAYGGNAVPSAFPTNVFEVSWALSTILDPSVMFKPVLTEDADVLASFFTNILDKQQGVVGFTTGVLEDADDTARVLLTLKRLGKGYDHTFMVSKFESGQSFRTYALESNPSSSANCNVLLALLEGEKTERTAMQVDKILGFLLNLWANGKAKDKWNTSPHYLFALFSDALVRVLERYNNGDLANISEQLVLQKIPATICQLLSEILSTQQDDGSWDSSLQVTSYAILTLSQCLNLPWSQSMSKILTSALDRGRCFMTANEQYFYENEYLWIEKVTYASSLLQSVYCLAARYIRPRTIEWSEAITNTFVMPQRHAQKIQHLFSKLPLLQERPLFCTELALTEALSLSGYLRAARLTIFPRDQIPVAADKYLEYIPMLWLAANQVGRNVLPPALVSEMCLQSMLIYQIDEYMESVVADLLDEELLSLDLDLQRLCDATMSTSCQQLARQPQIENSECNKADVLPKGSNAKLEAIKNPLIKYIDQVISHPAVIQLDSTARNELRLEIYDFLHAHIMQNVLNRQLKAQKLYSQNPDQPPSRNTRIDYPAWVRSLGANTTSCPMALRLFICLIDYHFPATSSEPRPSQSPVIKYCLDLLGRHLATLCRQYNDIGSISRDRDEGNLNSLDFSLFEPKAAQGTSSNSTDYHNRTLTESKSQLMQMADVERACVELVVCKLHNLLPAHGGTFLRQVQAFVDVTDLFGQIYIVRDFSSRVK